MIIIWSTSPSNFIFFNNLHNFKEFFQFLIKIFISNQLRLNYKFIGFVQALFYIFSLGQNRTLESFQLCLLVVVLIELSLLSQMSTFCRNLNHHWERRERKKESLKTILVIVFCNFQMFYYRSYSPQVKR